MEVNFGNTPSTPATDVTATVVSSAPAAPVTSPSPAPSQVPAVTSKLLLGDELPDFKDIILPRVNMAQNIGGLQEMFVPGSIVYNQQLSLYIPGRVNPKTQTVERVPTSPLTVLVFGFKKVRYFEKVKWGAEGGAGGMIVDSEEAVRANGGTLDFNEFKAKEKSGMKRFEPGIDAMVAIQRPEGDDAETKQPLCPDDSSTFNFEVEGKKYALAFWGLRGTCYTAACKRVLFHARRCGCIRTTGYPYWTWSVTTREESWPGGVKSWIPVFVANKPSTEEQINFVKSILGA